jgi:signal transduction histidine kinase
LNHTRDVLLQIDQLRGSLSAAESSARGYVITSAPNLRSDLDRAIWTMQRSAARLKTLVARDQQERGSLRALDSLLADRLEVLRTQVSLKNSGAAQYEIELSVVRGLVLSGQIDQILDDIRSEELGQFRLKTSGAESARRFAVYGPVITCFIALIMFGTLLLQVAATLKREEAMRAALQRAAREEHAGRERAQESDQMKEQLLATVSHELRTPLTSIIGWCGLLGEEKSRAALLDEGLANIAQAARIQSQLVDDLLDASRVIAGRLKLCVAECDPARVIDQAIAAVAPPAHAKGISIRRLENVHPRRLLADATRLEQIVWNLLSNAIKFTPSNGSVEVALCDREGQLEITVTDNGEGIAPDLLPHIFDRFRQGNASGSRTGGLGLGLSIVKSLVELHGGTVRAESAGRGAGATFIVELPRAVAGQVGKTEPEQLAATA